MLTRIETLFDELSRSEQKVAQWVISNPNAAVHLSIAALAEASSVSEPTVIRFCRAVGCEGYQDFKLSLAGHMASGVGYVHRDVSPKDSAADLSSKVFDRSIATLIRARNNLNPTALSEAMDRLANAGRIEIYGLGASGLVAADAQHKLFRLGIPVISYSDPHVQCMSAAMLKQGDVLIVISHTGRSKDLIDSANLARESGAAVIGITVSGSPLSKSCDLNLYADVSEDTETFTPMTSRLVHLTIIDTLEVGVALRLGNTYQSKLKRAKESLHDKRLMVES